MTSKLALIIILIGHVLGDFYFQTDKMVEERKERYSAVLKHGAIYMVVMVITFFAGMQEAIKWIELCAITSVLHVCIDSLKFIYEKKMKEKLPWFSKHLFVMDQVLHLMSIIISWIIFGKNLVVRELFTVKMEQLPMLPIVVIFGILCILRPIGIWIAKSDLRKYKLKKRKKYNLKNAGKIIGYWERVIVFVLLLYEQFGAIGFVLTAKSIARFKEIEKNQVYAEYYLIGTLMSIGSVLVVWAILRLC